MCSSGTARNTIAGKADFLLPPPLRLQGTTFFMVKQTDIIIFYVYFLFVSWRFGGKFPRNDVIGPADPKKNLDCAGYTEYFNGISEKPVDR
jgi:hypothetical protein